MCKLSVVILSAIILSILGLARDKCSSLFWPDDVSDE
jgi:hypothetical protein